MAKPIQAVQGLGFPPLDLYTAGRELEEGVGEPPLGEVNGGGVKAAGGLAIARTGVLLGEEAPVDRLVIPNICLSGSSRVTSSSLSSWLVGVSSCGRRSSRWRLRCFLALVGGGGGGGGGRCGRRAHGSGSLGLIPSQCDFPFEEQLAGFGGSRVVHPVQDAVVREGVMFVVTRLPF